MTKPDDIPQDVMEMADDVCSQIVEFGEPAQLAVARAIMSERQACARLAQTADEYLPHDDRLEGLSNAGLDALVERDARIAHAIRNRSLTQA